MLAEGARTLLPPSSTRPWAPTHPPRGKGPPPRWRRARPRIGRAAPAIIGLSVRALPASLPQPLETAPCYARVMDGVPRVAMPEVVLHGAEVGAPIGKVVAA